MSLPSLHPSVKRAVNDPSVELSAYAASAPRTVDTVRSETLVDGEINAVKEALESGV